MQRLVAIAFLLATTSAFAHPGHVASESGHSHYLALGATLAAILIVVVAVARRIAVRRRRRLAHD